MEGVYDQLIRKLDQFIRKYYRNQIIRGGIYSTILISGYFILISLIEYFGRFGTATRAMIFWSSVFLIGFVLFWLVVLPLLHLFRIGTLISHDEAARIIGKHFSEVEDRLLNVLQLKSASYGSKELIQASIDQKSARLSPIPFQNAIDFRSNLTYVKYLLGPAIIVLIIFISGKEEILTQSPQRIVKYSTPFEEEAPFQFVVLNESLEVFQNHDYELVVQVQGDEVPEACFLEWNGMNYRMKKNQDGTYSYAFKKVREDQSFRFTAAGYNSMYYDLLAFPVPELLQFEMELDYPAYTKLRDESVKNTGDMRVPYGTNIRWVLNTRNTDGFSILFGDSICACEQLNATRFGYEHLLVSTTDYRFVPSNEYIEQESGQHRLEVVMDAYPSIQMIEETDSLDDRLRFFTLICEDDYGFSSLKFHYKKNGSEEIHTEDVKINRNLVRDQSFHYWDLRSENIELGDEIEYYFELWDNDGINGAKSSRTESKVYRAPSKEELKEKSETSAEEIKERMDESIMKAKEIQEKLEELNRKMLEKKELSWEEKKQLEKLLQQQKELQKDVQEIMAESKKRNREQSEYKEQSERILEKQRQLEELFEEMMTEEMQKMMEEMEKLLEEIDKDQLQEQIEEMQMSNEELEKELDRNLELFKQMEFEQKLEETINELEELAEEQKDLAEESKDPQSDPEEIQEKQEELNERFEELRKDMDDLQEKNKELERPNEMQDTEAQEEKIEEKMEKSSDDLQKGKKKDAQKNQEDASEEMEEMAEQMKRMQSQMASQRQGEDMESLRQILDNLVTLSVDQEDLMDEIARTGPNDPRYVELIREQNKLKDDSRIIEDSLYALSKRVLEIQSMITQEMTAINENMDKSVEAMSNRNSSEARNRQQYVMTSANNLALMLSEVLEQMQKQMAQMMQGSQACEKPGQGQPSMSEMRKKQEELNQQMKDMQGQNPEGDKPGDQQGEGKGGKGKNGKQRAQLAAQQEALRQQLREMAEEMMQGENGAPGTLGDALQKMEETERDLVNDEITEETLKRQEEILTKLLEAEEAEREQDWDNKRESNEALTPPDREPDAFLEYQKMKEKQAEMLETVPPDLQPFYKNLVDKYFSSKP